jgi:hypothetical protein
MLLEKFIFLFAFVAVSACRNDGVQPSRHKCCLKNLFFYLLLWRFRFTEMTAFSRQGTNAA